MLTQNLLLAGDNGYNLTKSLRFRSSASAYLNRTPASAGNRKTWTYSAWIKRGVLGTYQRLMSVTVGSDEHIILRESPVDTLHYVSGTASISLITSQVFRDPSAWYHIVVAVDTTQATASNRAKIYVNGVQVTAFSTATYPSQNADTSMNNSLPHGIGGPDFSQYFDGYMTEINVIDGQALTPSSFGSTNALTGVWQPAKYTGTYGTNGFYLPFTDVTTTSGSNAGLGKDFSGNGNYWNTNNISVTAGTTYDSMSDVPTLTSATTANYATANPLMNVGGIVNVTNGNLTATKSGNGDYIIPSTIAIPAGTGKWYWEVTATTISASSNFSLGVVNSTISTGAWGASSPSAVFWNASGGSRQAYNVPSTGTSWSVASGDVLGQALDATTGNFSLYKNGTLVETWNASVNTALSSLAFADSYASGESYSFNFGQRPFSYTPPTGFVALNTFNLPTSTIVKGNTVMDATTYSGTGASQNITNTAGFKPDFVWLKTRNVGYGHALFDSIRGVGNGLQSNNTNAEAAWGTSTLASFNSNGFGLGADTSYLIANSSGNTFVGWQWQAGQGTNTTNTSGSITSTVSVNPTARFSVVTYTGTGANATVGHGLGVAPSMIIVKQRNSSAENWLVYNSNFSTPSTDFLLLNSTAQKQALSNYWNGGASSSSFGIGGYSGINAGGGTYVAYCWSEIAGFSKFGSYTGNGSSDGTFVYTGFRPKFMMIKRTDTADSWVMMDTSRNPYNAVNLWLQAEGSNAESTLGTPQFDFVSNGMKLRGSSSTDNASGGTYIYMAFAENPFKNALAR